jgi:hypothetical protein
VAAGAKLDVSGVTGGVYAIGNLLGGNQYLHGSGTVKGNIAVSSGSSVAAAMGAVGKFTFDGDLDMVPGSNVTWDLGVLRDSATGTAGTDFDQIVVKGGDLDLGGAQLTLNFGLLAAGDQPNADPLNPFWTGAHSWKIIDVDADNGGTNSGMTNFGSIVVSGFPAPSMSFTTTVGTTPGVNLGDIFLKVGTAVDIPGDANRDGVVNAADAQAVAANWGIGSGATWENGDFNKDGAVNAADASIMAANWGYGTSEESAGNVPEPAMVSMLLAAALLGLAALRRRT